MDEVAEAVVVILESLRFAVAMTSMSHLNEAIMVEETKTSGTEVVDNHPATTTTLPNRDTTAIEEEVAWTKIAATMVATMVDVAEVVEATEILELNEIKKPYLTTIERAEEAEATTAVLVVETSMDSVVALVVVVISEADVAATAANSATSKTILTLLAMAPDLTISKRTDPKDTSTKTLAAIICDQKASPAHISTTTIGRRMAVTITREVCVEVAAEACVVAEAETTLAGHPEMAVASVETSLLEMTMTTMTMPEIFSP